MLEIVLNTGSRREGISICMLPESCNLERRLARRLPVRLRRLAVAGDHTAGRFMERHAIAVLRVALAIVFLWFGALKVLGYSPVEDVVKQTVSFLPGDPFFFILGLWEIVIALGLLVPIALRVTLVLFWLQLGGTFLTLIVLPDRSFQGGNPLLLSVLGEFVVKNLVLVAAGLAIGASVPRRLQRPGFREDAATPDPG
jgi:putative oxidoreductase